MTLVHRDSWEAVNQLHRQINRLFDLGDTGAVSSSATADWVPPADIAEYADKFVLKGAVMFTAWHATDIGKQTQWRSFIRRSQLQHMPDTLADVIITLAIFLGPIAKALASREVFEHVWQAPGPWRRIGN